MTTRDYGNRVFCVEDCRCPCHVDGDQPPVGDVSEPTRQAPGTDAVAD